MEKLYVAHDDAAIGAGLHPADLRTIRRVLNCPVPERRVSGSKKLHFELELIVEWMAHVLPRLSPEQEARTLASLLLARMSNGIPVFSRHPRTIPADFRLKVVLLSNFSPTER